MTYPLESYLDQITKIVINTQHEPKYFVYSSNTGSLIMMPSIGIDFAQ